MRLLKQTAALLAVLGALAGCGSTASTTASDEVSTTTAAGGEAALPAAGDEVSTTTAAGDEAALPAAGDETAAVLNFTIPECSNSGELEAFGRTWNQTGQIPSGSWRDRAPLEGVLRFTSLEVATFEVDGESVEMTHTGDIDAECNEWPQ